MEFLLPGFDALTLHKSNSRCILNLYFFASIMIYSSEGK